MIITDPSVEILTPINGREILEIIESCGRVCYRSVASCGSAEKFVKAIVDRGHDAVLEHYNITVKFVCDRGVSHEIVRHRLASYCQESTRYCNYAGDRFGNELTFIRPCFWDSMSQEKSIWVEAMKNAEKAYMELIEAGAKPEHARSVLPNSLKTELVMTANLREWRHFLKLRTAPDAHPQMRQVACMLLEQFRKTIPVVFDEIGTAEQEEQEEQEEEEETGI